MTVKGQIMARPAKSPHANLTAVLRVGATSWGSAVWRVECTCGKSFEACAPVIKSGGARCETCNPNATAKQMSVVLAAMPGTYSQIGRRSKLSEGKVKYALDLMRIAGKCFIGDWKRASAQGGYHPIFHAGAGTDVPCQLKPIPLNKSERAYRRRIKTAIAKAEQGGPEDGRYLKHISRHLAKKTAARTRRAPATWLSALGVGS